MELISALDGYVFIETDSEMREIAFSHIPEALKIKLLPIKNPQAFELLDSKVGLHNVSRKLDLSFPESTTVVDKNELHSMLKDFPRTVLLKSDRGGGGEGIFDLRELLMSGEKCLIKLNFPVLVQEKLEGTEISIDAYFFNGELRAYMYSEAQDMMYKFGPTIYRNFKIPPLLDFCFILQTLGEYAKVTGFVNTTFLRDDLSGKHTIIEFDTRANAWHYLANNFAIDIKSIFQGKQLQMLQANNYPDQMFLMSGRYIYHLTMNLQFKEVIGDLRQLKCSKAKIVSPIGLCKNVSALLCFNIFSRVILLKLFRSLRKQFKLMYKIS